jgi:hypothetical protein
VAVLSWSQLEDASRSPGCQGSLSVTARKSDHSRRRRARKVWSIVASVIACAHPS